MSWRAVRGTAAVAAASSPALRCSWNARICSSMERSTLRTSTPSGTFSTVGAKFRMEVTPAATSRSQTCWAAPAGVAITPIDTPLSWMIFSRSSVCFTGMPAGRGVPVNQGADAEAAGGETSVVGEGGAEVADTDDHNRPVLGQAQFAGDLVHEILDVVAHAARPVGAQVGEVLAQLRGVD